MNRATYDQQIASLSADLARVSDQLDAATDSPERYAQLNEQLMGVQAQLQALDHQYNAARAA